LHPCQCISFVKPSKSYLHSLLRVC
jgi:hypothetical protein